MFWGRYRGRKRWLKNVKKTWWLKKRWTSYCAFLYPPPHGVSEEWLPRKSFSYFGGWTLPFSTVISMTKYCNTWLQISVLGNGVQVARWGTRSLLILEKKEKKVDMLQFTLLWIISFDRKRTFLHMNSGQTLLIHSMFIHWGCWKIVGGK